MERTFALTDRTDRTPAELADRWHDSAIAELADAEEYTVAVFGADGYRESVSASLLWLPSIGRGAVEWGADPQWSDASNPEDLLRRWAEDEMLP